MKTSRKESRGGSKLKEALVFGGHQILGTFVVGLWSLLLAGVAVEIPRVGGRFYTMTDAYRLLSGTPYYPVQIAVGILWGWLVANQFPHKSMLWTWVLPGGILCYVFATTSQSLTFVSRLSYFFGWGCRPENGCWDQIGYTALFYMAAGYSVGLIGYTSVSARHIPNGGRAG